MAVYRHQEPDLSFLDRLLLAFYPQDFVTVLQVKIDPDMRKSLLQEANDISGNQVILHVGFEDFYNVHIDTIVRYSSRIAVQPQGCERVFASGKGEVLYISNHFLPQF